MTQKAVTDALTSLDNKIKTSGGSASGVSNLGIDAAGHIVIVGPDGTITAGEMTEAAILQALIKSGTYTAEGTVGITVDYENKSSERKMPQDYAQEAILTPILCMAAESVVMLQMTVLLLHSMEIATIKRMAQMVR